MKRFLCVIVLFFISIVSIGKTFTFNFTEGKVSSWSNLENWSNSEYPQEIAELDSVKILAPDNSKGWICNVDTGFSTNSGHFIIGDHVQFRIMKGFSLVNSDCLSPATMFIHVNAELFVMGGLSIGANSKLMVNGPATIFGSLSLNETNKNCLGGFAELNGISKVYGSINSIAGELNANDLWLMKNATMTLQQGFDLESRFYFKKLVNEGNISSNGQWNDLSVGALVNKGIINLPSLSRFSAGQFDNSGSIYVNGAFSVSGGFSNSGMVQGEALSSQSPNTFSISGSVINNGGVFLDFYNYNLSGSLINNSSFGISFSNFRSANIIWNLFTVNTGSISLNSTAHFNEPVINKGTINLQTRGDSTRISGPFINYGKVSCEGSLYFNAGFINKGELELLPGD